MPVVALLVLGQRVPEVGLVPDQCALQQFGAERLDPAFGDRVHAGHPDTSQHRGDARGAEDPSINAGYLRSRSRMRNLTCGPCSVSSKSMSMLRMAWVTLWGAKVGHVL